MTETRQHHRVGRGAPHGLLQGRDGLGAASESLECPPGKKMAPVERRFQRTTRSACANAAAKSLAM
jgi:hypothetical protein